MHEHLVRRSTCVLFAALLPAAAHAQSAMLYHLHREQSKTNGLFQLRPADPDANATSISFDLRNQPANEYLVKAFDTVAGVPNAAGIIPAGSTVSVTLWMRKTSAAGTMYPRAKLRLNSTTGPAVCVATGASPLTTTIASYTLTCSSTANVTMATSDRFYLWAGVNLTTAPGSNAVKAELDIEGTLNGNYDSQVLAPLPIPPPVIGGVSPQSGIVGTTVTISGSGFGTTQGSSTVTFNGAPAAASAWTSTTITASVPAAATTGPVVVTVRGLASNSVPFTVPPVIAQVSPSAAAVATPVTITGANFGSVQGASTVSFNGIPATPLTWSGSSISVTVPSAASSGPVVVSVGGVASNAVPFSVVPSIANLSPTAGPVGTLVTINGASFGSAQGASTVAFNGVAATPANWSASAIVAPVPPGAATGNVVVMVGGLASNGSMFVVPPIATTVSPSAARVGSSVTISGSNFGSSQGSSVVTFNGVVAAPTRWSATSIDAPVPAGASSGPVVVMVTGQPSNSLPFTVIVPGSIAGVVTRATGGTPIAGATVVVASAGALLDTATTAADGSYAIGDLDPGSYDVIVSAAGYGSETRLAVIVSPASATRVDVAMLGPGALTGKVTNADGSAPIAGATVRAIGGSLEAGVAVTDAAGDYRVPSLRPGSYTVRASNVGYRTSERSALVVEDAATIADFALETQPPGSISYAYDAVGRLVQVIDPNGDFAVYHYDAVGNVLAIDRPASGVSIAGLVPESGGVGDLVTILGGGFDASGQNSVSFNGMVATLESATATQIMARVPAGATSGLVTVSTPTGTATSGSPFVVAANGGRPAIVALNPTIGVTGTPFTITGTNFDAAAGGNRADLNGRVTSISASAPTALTTSVPAFAMGGRVTVATPRGLAVSDGDFVVVPPPNGPADVEVADRLTIGISKSFTIATPDKIALLLFDGESGQRVSFFVSSSTISAGSISIYRPDGLPMAGSGFTGTNTFIDSQVLPITGTYTIRIDPAAGVTGSMTLASFNVTDVSGSIALNGGGVPVSIATPGQNAFLSFPGTAGQLLSATATSSVWTSCQFGGQYSLAILKPDGSLLGSVTNACGSTTILERQTLPMTGTYYLRLDPYGTNTGSATLALYAFADVTAPIVPGGASVPVSIAVPGQLALLTFSGMAGQSVSAASTSSTWTSCQFGGQYNFGVLKPDGSILTLATNACGSTTFLDRVTLPVTGTYSVRIDPYGANTGSATVTLWDIVDVTGSIALDGTAVSVPISAPSQNARLTFTGTAGQVVSAYAATPWFGCIDSPHFYLKLIAPDGSVVTTSYDSCSGGNAFMDQIALPASGTFTLMLDPIGMWTGTASLMAWTFVDVTGPIAPNGPSVPVTIATPGQNARLTFTGTAGQVVTAVALTPWNGCIDSPHVYLKLVSPTGSTLITAYDSCSGGRASTGQITLPVSGTYTVVLDPLWTRTGNATVTLTSP
jgi:YD repeat-containing protein